MFIAYALPILLFLAPGNLTAVVNENGEAVRFEHDAADRLIAQVGLDGKRTETQLDPLGLPTRVTEAAGTAHALVTGLERDLMGRLLKKTTPESITVYSRDALGRVTRIARTDLADKPIDALDFSFDAQGNLATETQTLWRNGNGKPERHTLAHAYDPLGNRIATTLPDGRTLNNLLYGSGHLHQVNLDGRVICDFERDALHRETRRSQGGLALRTQYDPLSRVLARVSQPLAQRIPAPAGLSKQYRYDANGELIHRADSWLGEVTLEHDPTGRILSARSLNAGKAGIDEQYRYDEAANLLNPWGEGRGYVRHNRLEVFEDKRYQYDEYGRLVEKRIGRHTAVHLRWDKEHRLVESTVEKNGRRQRSRYEYDALGRRVARRDACTETRFIWDGMRLLQEVRGHQGSTYLYQPGSHEPVARIDSTEAGRNPPTGDAAVYHFHTHINGAPEELTDEAGRTLWRARYRAWGALAREEADERLLPSLNPWDGQATRQPLRMQGQYADAETGLYYNTFRYYDPDIGRFVSEDPIGLLGGLNLYQYAANADGWVDPWGWKPCFIGQNSKRTKHTPNRHIDREKYPEKSKYKKPSQYKKLEDRTMKNPDRVVEQGGKVRYEKDYDRVVGTRGETGHVVVHDKAKNKIVTSFPASFE